MKKYVISDIHGCAKTFKALLDKISLSPKDELYLLGDYIDRGPDSKGVIDYIWHLEETGHTVHCLRGNHEQMFLHAIEARVELLGIQEARGYAETLASFGTSNIDTIPTSYIKWMKGLAFYLEVDQYILVHAGLNFKSDNPFDNKTEMIWIRHWYEGIDRAWLGDRIIVHGHTPTRQLEIKNSIRALAEIPAIDIDNGCPFESLGFGHLCAFELGTQTFTFQANIDRLESTSFNFS